MLQARSQGCQTSVLRPGRKIFKILKNLSSLSKLQQDA
jgi:hypothetical protein